MLTYQLEQRGDMTKYEYLCSRIKGDILSGSLPDGTRMPSKRVLAEHHGISVLTVENAYAQLVAEGYLTAKPRSGFYVSAGKLPREAGRTHPVPPAPEAVTDAAAAGTDNRFRFASLSRIMRRVISDYAEKLLDKPPNFGCIELREAISAHLCSYRGMDAPAERIVIGSGAEYLYVLLAQLFGSETVFGIEDPSYSKIGLVYRSLGKNTEKLSMDRDGITPEALERSAADVLHITPYHSYPTGISTSAKRRMEYLRWANRRGGFLIEDDFDSEFALCRRPLETIFAMDHSDSVIYCNTFTKSLAPSMRMGYMVLPERLTEQYRRKLGFYSCTVPAFEQYVLAEYIAQGYFERHLNRLRRTLGK